MWNSARQSIRLLYSFNAFELVPNRATYFVRHVARKECTIKKITGSYLRYSIRELNTSAEMPPTCNGLTAGSHLLQQEDCKDEENPVIFSNQEENRWMTLGELDTAENSKYDSFHGISLQRGTTGVFDVEELVDLLNQENLLDIVAIKIPQELQFVDYMVITTGKSHKQMAAIADLIRRVYKQRALATDFLPVIEGKENKDWIALDLGNIALHIFSKNTREKYDLETLWTCGVKYDDLSKQIDEEFCTNL